MPSLRKRRAEICDALLRLNVARALEDLLWDRMAPIGREFGSPNFDRLMEEDYRDGCGHVDPSLMARFRLGIGGRMGQERRLGRRPA